MPPVRLDKTLDTNQPPSSAPHLLRPEGMPMHIYPVASPYLPLQQPLRSKRRQVKNACTHCQKACKKCDDARPCLRCIKYGFSEECVDSQRKERKKGIKRGPYKKRDGKDRAGSSIEHSDGSQQGSTISNVPHPDSLPIPLPYMSIGYPLPGFYGPYPPVVSGQDAQPVYPGPQYYLTSVPPHIQHPLHGGPDIDSQYQAQGFYPTTVLPSMPYHPQYAVPRSEGHLPNQYTVYPSPTYPKEASPGETLSRGNDEQEGISGK